MLEYGEPNILTIKNLRRVESHCPPHFERVVFHSMKQDQEILNWIWEKLSGRFYFGTTDVPLTNRPGYARMTLVSFEIPSEASMFTFFLST